MPGRCAADRGTAHSRPSAWFSEVRHEKISSRHHGCARARHRVGVGRRHCAATGPYVGINGGGGWGNSSFSAPLPSTNFDTSGGLVGGTLGYNWQANQIVFGLEGDIDWSHFTGSGTCGGVSCSVRNDWLGTARGRLGYAFDRFLPYVTGGAAFGNIKTAKTGIGSADESRVGWTLGGGVEYGLSGPWSIKAEYLYVDLGNGGSIGGSTASFRTSIVRAGINYRF